jgi:hypothetical protein
MAVLISWMSAIQSPSPKTFNRVLGCNISEVHKVGTRILGAAFLGPFAISRIMVQSRERGITYGKKRDTVSREEVRNASQSNAGEREGAGEEEDEERDGDENQRRRQEEERDMEEERQQIEGDEENEEPHGEQVRERAVGLSQESASDEVQ